MDLGFCALLFGSVVDTISSFGKFSTFSALGFFEVFFSFLGFLWVFWDPFLDFFFVYPTFFMLLGLSCFIFV